MHATTTTITKFTNNTTNQLQQTRKMLNAYVKGYHQITTIMMIIIKRKPIPQLYQPEESSYSLNCHPHLSLSQIIGVCIVHSSSCWHRYNHTTNSLPNCSQNSPLLLYHNGGFCCTSSDSILARTPKGAYKVASCTSIHCD